MRDLSFLTTELGDIPVFTDPARRKQRSRDFYWYSPRLRPMFDDVVADMVIVPRNEDEALQAIRLCWKHDVPLTARGTGTGNYGQAIPLKGGVVLDLSDMTGVVWMKPGSVRVRAGTRVSDLEREARAQGQELRLFPSTIRSATIGGFIAGGSAGIGAANWGLLRDRGNIIGARVLTMEEHPRILELRGDDIQKVNHAYGTNGIITELELPLAPAYDWMDAIVVFDKFEAATLFGKALVEAPGLLKRMCTLLPAPIPQDYFKAHSARIAAGKHSIFTMIAPQSYEGFLELVREMGGEVVYSKSLEEIEAERAIPLYEYAWNHTTMWAIKADKSMTYIQTFFSPEQVAEVIPRMNRHFGDEVIHHLEFVRAGGSVACFGIQLVRYTSEARLNEIMDYYENNGCAQFNPHAYTLEEGGMKQVDLLQLDFKREADPKGLLNPGKMLAWDDPSWTAETNKSYLYAAG